MEAVIELYLVDVALHPDFFLEVVEFAAAYQFGIDIVGMEDEPLELYTVFAVAYCNKYGTNTPEDVATKATRKIFSLLFPDNVFIYNTEAQTTSSTTLRS